MHDIHVELGIGIWSVIIFYARLLFNEILIFLPYVHYKLPDI